MHELPPLPWTRERRRFNQPNSYATASREPDRQARPTAIERLVSPRFSRPALATSGDRVSIGSERCSTVTVGTMPDSRFSSTPALCPRLTRALPWRQAAAFTDTSLRSVAASQTERVSWELRAGFSRVGSAESRAVRGGPGRRRLPALIDASKRLLTDDLGELRTFTQRLEIVVLTSELNQGWQQLNGPP